MVAPSGGTTRASPTGVAGARRSVSFTTAVYRSVRMRFHTQSQATRQVGKSLQYFEPGGLAQIGPDGEKFPEESLLHFWVM